MYDFMAQNSSIIRSCNPHTKNIQFDYKHDLGGEGYSSTPRISSGTVRKGLDEFIVRYRGSNWGVVPRGCHLRIEIFEKCVISTLFKIAYTVFFQEITRKSSWTCHLPYSRACNTIQLGRKIQNTISQGNPNCLMWVKDICLGTQISVKFCWNPTYTFYSVLIIKMWLIF